MNDYVEYLERCSLDELKAIALNIDRALYPKRYELLLKRISFLQNNPGLAVVSHQTEEKDGRLEKVQVVQLPWHKSQVPWTNILCGIIIPIPFLALMMATGKLSYFQIRPWVLIPVLLGGVVLFNATLMVVTWIQIKRQQLSLWGSINTPGSFAKEFVKSIFLIIPTNIAIHLIVVVVIKVMGITPGDSGFISFAKFAPNSWFLLAMLISAITVAPILEELFFRGWLYSALKTRTSTVVAILLQAVIFAIIHLYNAFQTLVVFLLGIALALIYEYRKNILAPIVVHTLRNAMITVPLILALLWNLHHPAPTFQAAENNPDWLHIVPPDYVEKQADGPDQYEYAIEKWGAKGSRKWKKAANALRAVSYWFPHDRRAVSMAELKLAQIFYRHLRDFRRSIVVAETLILKFPEQTERCAAAWLISGWSQYGLREFENSRAAFQEVVKEYSGYHKLVASAKKGLELISVVE